MRKILSLSDSTKDLPEYGLYFLHEGSLDYPTYLEIERKLAESETLIEEIGVFEKGFLLNLNYSCIEKESDQTSHTYSDTRFPFLSEGLLRYLGYSSFLRNENGIISSPSFTLSSPLMEWYLNQPRFSKYLLEEFQRKINLLPNELSNIVKKLLNQDSFISYCYLSDRDTFKEYVSQKEVVFGELLNTCQLEQRCSNLIDAYRVLETIFLQAYLIWKEEVKSHPIISVKHFSFYEDFLPAYPSNNIPVLLSSSNYYVPYCDVVIKSITDNCSERFNYDIIILEQDITEENKEILNRNKKRNVTIRFLDPRAFYFDKPRFYEAVKEFGSTRFAPILAYRAFCPYLLTSYEKVIWLDCDLIVKKDLAELYSTNLDNCFAGMVRDLAIMGFLNGSDKELGNYYSQHSSMINPYMYSNAGVVLLNLDLLRKEIPFDMFVQACLERKHAIPEQDTINSLWEGKVKHLDLRWNVFSFGKDPACALGFVPFEFLKKYKEAVKDPWIIHYVGPYKPWDELEVRKSEMFWEVARKSPFYEEILSRWLSRSSKTSTGMVSKLERVLTKILPKDSRRRYFVRKLYRLLLR